MYTVLPQKRRLIYFLLEFGIYSREHNLIFTPANHLTIAYTKVYQLAVNNVYRLLFHIFKNINKVVSKQKKNSKISANDWLYICLQVANTQSVGLISKKYINPARRLSSVAWNLNRDVIYAVIFKIGHWNVAYSFQILCFMLLRFNHHCLTLYNPFSIWQRLLSEEVSK